MITALSCDKVAMNLKFDCGSFGFYSLFQHRRNENKHHTGVYQDNVQLKGCSVAPKKKRKKRKKVAFTAYVYVS